MEKEVQPRSMYPLNIHAHAVYIVNFVIWTPYIYMSIYIVHPGRLAAGTWKWWFGRWFSFSRGPVFSGSMLILPGVYSKVPLVELFTKHMRQGTEWQPCETWQAARRRGLCLGGFSWTPRAHRIHGTGLFTKPFPIECGHFSPNVGK